MTKIQQIKHRQSVEYWKKVIAAQRSSGVDATEYCRQQNINYNAFYYWLRKIRQDIIDASEKLPVTADHVYLACDRTDMRKSID